MEKKNKHTCHSYLVWIMPSGLSPLSELLFIFNLWTMLERHTDSLKKFWMRYSKGFKKHRMWLVYLVKLSDTIYQNISKKLICANYVYHMSVSNYQMSVFIHFPTSQRVTFCCLLVLLADIIMNINIPIPLLTLVSKRESWASEHHFLRLLSITFGCIATTQIHIM